MAERLVSIKERDTDLFQPTYYGDGSTLANMVARARNERDVYCAAMQAAWNWYAVVADGGGSLKTDEYAEALSEAFEVVAILLGERKGGSVDFMTRTLWSAVDRDPEIWTGELKLVLRLMMEDLL